MWTKEKAMMLYIEGTIAWFCIGNNMVLQELRSLLIKDLSGLQVNI